MSYDQHFRTKGPTPQTEPTPGRSDEVEGKAGGYVFQVAPWTSLDRFLILGSEAPTYYASAKELTVENCTVALELIKASGPEVVRRLADISLGGRAPSNDPALFVLAMASSEGDLETRRLAFKYLPEVARTATHLFHFIEYRKAFGGWGRLMKKGIADWYLRMSPSAVAFQAVKYRQRDGWTHRDVLRKAHPKTASDEMNSVFRWITGFVPDEAESIYHLPPIITGFERIQKSQSPEHAEQEILNYGLPREAVPTEFLKSPHIWEALLYSNKGMPLGALIRNLGNMSKVGMLTPMSHAASYINSRLTNRDALAKARIHPYAVMVAMKTYAEGKGFRGTSTWNPVSTVVDALEAAMEMSFDFVEPSGKRALLCMDVSGSMGAAKIRDSNITAREAAAVMALVTARREDNYQIMAFSDGFVPLDLSKRDSFRGAIAKTTGLPFNGTDCALPMLYAMGMRPKGALHRHRTLEYEQYSSDVIPIDTFVVYTDSETWAGNVKPFEALREYRQRSGIDAKLVVVGLTSNQFTIADPTDAGMLDVVGFDTAAPSVIADFSR